MDNGLRMSALFLDELAQWKEASHELNNKQIITGQELSLEEKASNGWNGLKIYCFEEFMEGSVYVYQEIANLCKEHNIKQVYDIGSCVPFQGKIFSSMGIDYTAIEMETNTINCATLYDGMEIVKGTYPFPINVKDKDHTVAVSSLCMGYLLKDATLGYEQLAKDFRYFCGSLGPDCFDAFQKRFGVLSASQDGDIIWADTHRVHEPNIKALRRVDFRFNKLFNIRINLNNVKKNCLDSKKVVHSKAKNSFVDLER